MMPYLKGRIINTVRCPDGIYEGSFFKKHLENERNGICKIILKNKENLNEDYYYITN